MSKDAKVRKVVGTKIRELRKDGGFSQESLAAAAKLSAKYVGELERGQANPTVEVLAQLARALKTTASNLVAGI